MEENFLELGSHCAISVVLYFFFVVRRILMKNGACYSQPCSGHAVAMQCDRWYDPKPALSALQPLSEILPQLSANDNEMNGR